MKILLTIVFLAIITLVSTSTTNADNYANKIFHIYPTATDRDFTLEDDGTGVKLKSWNASKLGVKPTLLNLDLQVDDNTANDTASNKAKRKKFDEVIIKAVVLAMKDYLNELRVIESLPVLANNEIRDKIEAYLP